MASTRLSSLTAPTISRTKAPFANIDPKLVSGSAGVDSSKLLVPHPSQTISVESTSELVELKLPVGVFRTRQDEHSSFRLVHDINGRPMIFSIASDGHLYCIVHIEGASDVWQSVDISPSVDGTGNQKHQSMKITALDVLEMEDKIHVAVALLQQESTAKSTVDKGGVDSHDVYWATIDRPSLVLQNAPLVSAASALEECQWTKIVSSIGPRKVSKLMCAKSSDPQCPFLIYVGTSGTDRYMSSLYVLDPSRTATEPWSELPLAGQSLRVVDLLPYHVSGLDGQSMVRSGVVVLHEPASGTSPPSLACNILALDSTQRQFHHNHKLETGGLGNISAIGINLDSWGSTDVLVTGSNGIGFYPSRHITNPVPQFMFGPEKIAIKQVISQENYTASMEDDVPGQDKCVLTILAVSDEDEMYLVTGERDLANYGFPRFHYSAIPLRSDVSHISCRYNGHVDITEILYQSTSENSISYMTRDTETSMWTSADLKIKSPQKKHAQSMFLTTLTITNELGQPIPDGYPVHLTAEPMFVSINGLSCRLSRKRPTLAYTTEGLGQIEIKTSAPGDLGVSAVNLSLFKFVESGGDEMTVSINIAQRVTENLGSIKSQADLDNLRSASGASLFANHSTDKRSAATTLLTNFGDLYKGISGENPTGGSDSVDMATIVCETGAKSPKAMILNDYIPEWLDNIVDAAVEYLGDAIECLRQAVKSVTKFAFKIFGSELRFLVKIGAKVLRFVITNTVALVKSVVGFLKDVFEFDLLAWLGFKFDFKKVLETQTMLKSFTLGSIDFGKRFIEVNKESLINIFDDSEEALFGQVKSSIAPDLRKKPSAFEQSVRALLNSPILKLLLSWNPVAWVVEGMTEGLADEFSDFELPDLQPLMHALGDGFQNMGEIGIKTFFRIADALGSALLDIASDPSRAVSVFLDMLKDLFREIFGTVRDLTLGAYDVLVRAIDCVPAILTGKWVIPDLTDMYEEMTEQEFSLLNYATFALAALLEFMAVSAGATQSLGAKLSLPEKWSESLPLEPLYTPVREAMDQMAIQARYPGPSLPEHTQPMVMMITKAGRDTPQAGPAEAEKVKIETTKGKNNYESERHWVHVLRIINSAARVLITEVEVAEAAMHYKGKNGVGSSHGSGVSILGVVKFISGLTAVTTMGIEFTLSCRFTNYSQLDLVATIVGVAVSGLGMVIDGMVSFVPSSDGTDNENVLICAALGGQGGTLLRTCGVPDLVEKFHGEHLCHSIGAAYAMTAVFFAAKIEEPSTKAIFTGAALGNDIFWSLIAISFGVKDLVDGGKHH